MVNTTAGKYTVRDFFFNQDVRFSKLEELESYIRNRKIGFYAMLILGIVALIAVVSDGEPGLFFLLFLPYMIRYATITMHERWNSGVFGEFLCFMIVILGSLTLVFPLVKSVKEFFYYIEANNRINQYKRFGGM